jgi:hypothetical protein
LAKADLKPCPACGKKQGELVELRGGARFPFAVHSKACGWSTPYVKLAGVAEERCQAPKRQNALTGRSPDQGHLALLLINDWLWRLLLRS